jgi:ferritin
MREALAAQVYLSYGAWLKDKGYDGIANFLFRHSAEERNHMMKILEYVLERGAKVTISAIPEPGSDPDSVYDCFKKVFKQEVNNTESVYKLVKMSFDEQDWATWNFLQWFVREQVEEETLAHNLLDKIKIAGGDKANDEALYNLDKDLSTEPDHARLAQDVTVENP